MVRRNVHFIFLTFIFVYKNFKLQYPTRYDTTLKPRRRKWSMTHWLSVATVLLQLQPRSSNSLWIPTQSVFEMTIENSSLSPHHNAAFYCFFVQQLRHHRQRWRLSHSWIDKKSSPKLQTREPHDQTVKPALPHACQQNWVERLRCVRRTRGKSSRWCANLLSFANSLIHLSFFHQKIWAHHHGTEKCLPPRMETRLVSTCSTPVHRSLLWHVSGPHQNQTVFAKTQNSIDDVEHIQVVRQNQRWRCHHNPNHSHQLVKSFSHKKHQTLLSKQTTYLELCRGDRRVRFVVVVGEVDGRWFQETKKLLWCLASERAKSFPRLLQGGARAGWFRRWCGLLACSTAKAVAYSFVGHRGSPGVGDHVPSVHEVLTEARFALQLVRVFLFCLTRVRLIDCSFSIVVPKKTLFVWFQKHPRTWQHHARSDQFGPKIGIVVIRTLRVRVGRIDRTLIHHLMRTLASADSLH